MKKTVAKKSVKKNVAKKAAKATVKKSIATKRRSPGTKGKPPKCEKKFTLTLNMNDTVLETKGDTVIECLSALKHPAFFKTKAIFTVSDGKVKSEWRMSPFMVKRLLVNPISQVIFQKRMISIMK